MSWLWITPRRRFRSPTTSPTWSCGVVTSTSMIGSRMTGPAFFMPSRKQALAAISNASADESTSWYLPSTRRVLEVHRREAGQHAGFGLHLDALLDRRDVLLRHRAADHLVLELDARVALLRLEGDLHLGVLARAARLLLVGVGLGVRLGDGLAVGHLRRADIGVDAVFARAAGR